MTDKNSRVVADLDKLIGELQSAKGKLQEARDALPVPVPKDDDLWRIQTREQLLHLKIVLGVRHDWHEPDNQGVGAYVLGNHLDNAMGSGLDHSHGELQVIITTEALNGDSDLRPYAVINLATLLAWATGYDEATS